MSLLSAMRVALGALLVHKGRSLLTSLGIVIGIAAVIALVAAGDGARALLEQRLASIGKDLILVRPGGRTTGGVISEYAPLTADDARALRQHIGPLISVVAETQVTQRLVSTATTHAQATVGGCTPDLARARGWQLSRGRFIDAEDVKTGRAVCLLGQTARERLFPQRADPVGQSIRIDQVELSVIGVLAPKGRAPTGADQDDQVLMPLSTLQQRLTGEERLSVILVAARSEAVIDAAKEEVQRVLRQRRRLAAGSENFDVSSVREMAEIAVVLTGTLRTLIAVIGSISLVVGGIGIMNIMLVSVTERTREIGIRLAVGATPGNVLAQFLLEAVVLALAGGVIGVSVGLALAVALARAVGWPVVLSPAMVLLAWAVSGAVGVFFGYYPAWKASRLDPIDALRHE
jgi:putative ABC transport system permease protein